MPPRRFGPARPDVTLRVDGREVPAVGGEPVAIALAAAGRLVLGRSVKYHRPRGASCYAGRCDGCLMRVDGVPSRMTCRIPARNGMRIETQNVLGSAEHDLLAATDWLFPGGMNHHELFTWSRPVNRAMQTVARRVAGVGRLPDHPAPPVPPIEAACDVAVIGGGPSGLAAATAAARAGLEVVLIDEEDAPGGHLAWDPARVRLGAREITARAAATHLTEEARDAGVRIHSRRVAVAIYDPSPDGAVVIADGDDALMRLRARRIVLAQGRHEGAWAFEGNDLPGVIGSEAACRMLSHGVLPGERVLLAASTAPGGPASARLSALTAALKGAGAEVLGPIALDALLRARGRSGVRSCDVKDTSGVSTLECDAVVIAPPTSAVFELASQAGVAVTWRELSFELEVSPVDGWTRSPCARAVGRCAGVEGVNEGITQGIAAARAIATELRGAEKEARRG